MEQWQRDHIQQNICKLIDYTSPSCSITFLSAFQEKGLLTSEDVNSIDIIQHPYEKCWKFYEIIQRRAYSYEVLKDVFQDTKQTGALMILNQITAKNATTPFKNYGTISYDRSKLIGKGSYNTKVFQGRFENRDAAVKILSIEDVECDVAIKEIDLLTNLDWHPNIVRYFKAEITEDFVLIAIELCKMDLDQFITENQPIYPDAINIIKQITEGVIFLHSKQIVHRDLKPANILISYPETNRLIVKISDFGLGRKIKDGMSKTTFSASAVGTLGWMAPEVVKQLQLEPKNNPEGKIYAGKAADVFSLGCIFYFVLTNGEHPFGDPFLRQGNIILGKPDKLDSKVITSLEKFKVEAFLWLISQMIRGDEKERPTADIILAHPSFWETKKFFGFFKDIYPYISSCIDEIFCNANHLHEQVKDWNWLGLVDDNVQNYIESRGAVDKTKCSDLLKVIVEMYRAYGKLPKIVQQLLGKSTEYFSYWGNRFPFLLPFLWTIFQYSSGISKSILQEYYFETKNDFKFELGHQPTAYTLKALVLTATNAKPLLNICEESRPIHQVRKRKQSDMPNNESSSPTKIQSVVKYNDLQGEGASTSQPQCKTQFNKPVVISDLSRSNNIKVPWMPKNYICRKLKSRKVLLSESDLFNNVFSNTCKKAIIICGPTGIGKTSLLAQIGETFVSRFPTRKLIYFKLKNFVDEIRRQSLKQNVEADLIWSTLKTLTTEKELRGSSTNFPKSGNLALDLGLLALQIGIVYYAAKNISRQELTDIIFDGFEEVDDEDQNLVCDIIKAISNNPPPNLFRVWVAVLPKHLKKIEETTVDFESYSIEPLQDTDQVEIIVSYLENHSSQDRIKLLEFTRQCLTDIKADKKYDLGNPLQCLLVGAACLKGNYADSKCAVFWPQNVLDLNVSENLLLYAAKYTSIYTLELILNPSKSKIDCVDRDGNTPLFLSVIQQNNVDCLLKVRLLVERGADLNHLNKQNYNLVNFAAHFASFEVLEYVLSISKVDINNETIDGNTPLLLSTFLNIDCVEKLQLLLEKGAHLNHYHYNKEGSNLLGLAVESGDKRVINYVKSLKK